MLIKRAISRINTAKAASYTPDVTILGTRPDVVHN